MMPTMLSQNAPQVDCNKEILSLSPCLFYIIGLGGSSPPPPSCCSALSTIVKTSPQCLCSVVNGGGSFSGIPINPNIALTLPAACNVQTPPVSLCKYLSPPPPPF
uniref:Non-specific lipid-transfer protein-like protein At5g64080 family n=1 Tax=Cajanus cajan TaxID=3821 RepID=A0A151S2C4_CAJCA|nr:Non-specific lipid-transfer protein-like protein At5g64080 family [Cajanus cajan]